MQDKQEESVQDLEDLECQRYYVGMYSTSNF